MQFSLYLCIQKELSRRTIWLHESTVPLFHINDNTYHHKCYHCNNMNQIHKPLYLYYYLIFGRTSDLGGWGAGVPTGLFVELEPLEKSKPFNGR